MVRRTPKHVRGVLFYSSPHRYRPPVWTVAYRPIVYMDDSIRRNLRRFDDSDDEVAAIMIAIDNRHMKRVRRRRKRHGGSRPGKAPNKKRNFAQRWQRFQELYFVQRPVFGAETFRRRFRMRRALFERIAKQVCAGNTFFQHRRDAAGKLGIHPYMKVIAAFRVLCYGCSADSLDENLEISEAVVNRCVDEFCASIIEIYGDHYLRAPTEDDIARLLRENEERGFPGMMGSIDCMKWVWQNCPTAWRGAFRGKEKKPTVVLEAVASRDLHIWHAFIGMPGASNDINVLDASPLMSEYLDKDMPHFSYNVNGIEYEFVYWLADGIYPEWRCFVKTISAPIGDVEKYFAKAQEALRKDVERAFGVLQARFAIVARPSRRWKLDDVARTMRCCIILHNMIVEDDKLSGRATSFSSYQVSHGRNPEPHIAEFERLDVHEWDDVSQLEKYKDVQSSVEHFRLKKDLMQHLWSQRSRLHFKE